MKNIQAMGTVICLLYKLSGCGTVTLQSQACMETKTESIHSYYIIFQVMELWPCSYKLAWGPKQEFFSVVSHMLIGLNSSINILIYVFKVNSFNKNKNPVTLMNLIGIGKWKDGWASRGHF